MLLEIITQSSLTFLLTPFIVIVITLNIRVQIFSSMSVLDVAHLKIVKGALLLNNLYV